VAHSSGSLLAGCNWPWASYGLLVVAAASHMIAAASDGLLEVARRGYGSEGGVQQGWQRCSALERWRSRAATPVQWWKQWHKGLIQATTGRKGKRGNLGADGSLATRMEL
jgi:hypothetical protein